MENMSSINYPSRSRSLGLFIIACIGHFIVDFSIGLWPVWKTIAQYPLAEAGLAAGICVFIGEGMQSVFSLWADRGYWRILVGLGVLVATASLLLPLSGSLVAAGVLFFLTCLGSSAFHPTAVGMVASVQGMSRPVLISIFHTSGLLGLAISQVLFTRLYEKHTALPGILIALPCLLCILLYRYRPNNTNASQEHSTLSETKEKVRFTVFLEFLRRPALRKVYFLLLCNQIMAWSILFLLPDFLIEKGGAQSFAYGGGHFIYVLGSAFTCVPLGVLANRLNTPLVILMTYAVSIIALIFTLSAQTADPVIMGMLLFLLGGSMGAVAPLSLSIGNDLEPRRRATVSAFLMGFVWIFSEGCGYSLSSYIASCFSEDQAISALTIMGSVLFIGIIQAYLLFRQLEKAPMVSSEI